jgi:hypothetical protein
VTKLSELQSSWEVSRDEADDVIPTLYDLSINFESDGPGYVGPLYFIRGDAQQSSPTRARPRERGTSDRFPALRPSTSPGRPLLRRTRQRSILMVTRQSPDVLGR